MTQQVHNNAQSTLSGTILAGATTLVVASASTFPTSNDFSILIDSEIMLVTAVSGTTFTVTRGQEGTTAAGHTAGVTVTAPLTATALLNIIRRDHVGTAIPTGGASGDIKIGTGVLWFNDAGIWKSVTASASGGGTPTVYPQNTSLTFTTRPTIPAVPGYLSTYTDPTWGTKIVRVTNVDQDRHAYSRIPAFNADDTRIMMNFGTVAHHIISAVSPYGNIVTFTEPSTPIWSNIDPNLIYGCQGTNFVSVNATTGVQTTLRGFTTSTVGGTSITDILIGDFEGAISDDDRIVVLTANYNSGVNRRVITYNIATNTIVGEIAAPAGFDNAQCSRLGNYVVVVATGGTKRYTPDLSTSALISSSTNHGDNALNAGGEEIYVMNNAPLVKAVRLSDLVATNLFSNTTTAFEYGHMSGRATKRPGWVYLSVYDATATAGRQGFDQVLAVKTDGSGTVEVFGFTNHTRTQDGSALAYVSQPHACPSRLGDKVIAASDWNTANVYDYLFSA